MLLSIAQRQQNIPAFFNFLVGVLFTSSPMHFCLASSTIISLEIIHSQTRGAWICLTGFSFDWLQESGQLLSQSDESGFCSAKSIPVLANKMLEAVWRLCLASGSKIY